MIPSGGNADAAMTPVIDQCINDRDCQIVYQARARYSS